MAKARSLNAWQTMALILVLVIAPVLLTLLFITPSSDLKAIGVRAILPPQLKNSMMSSQLHLDAYAKELGELQARIMRLDAQNERLSKLAGEKEGSSANKTELKLNNLSAPNRGGPLLRQRPITESDLRSAIDELTSTVDTRDNYLSSLEAKILQKSVLKDMLPNSSPINAAYNSSSFGWRLDPFTGEKAFHEGLDFTANVGTSIRAAADGIVTVADFSGGYGNMVRIDHGSGLETRYGHASKLLVKSGDRVVKGQEIAEVGTSGRSTGPHLHYEIRLNGNALDPRQYLGRNTG